MLTQQLIRTLIMFPGLEKRTPNRNVSKLTSRRRGQLSNFFTDMTPVTWCPRSQFSSSGSLLTMATVQGGTEVGEDYFHSPFPCYTRLGNFLIHSRAQKSFTSKIEIEMQ
ncbi:hypothetical protein TNCV_821501 [Trichonephila clavipes]|nr:hypothetical protein TNCV_821501 [Trichonephila clavipes]